MSDIVFQPLRIRHPVPAPPVQTRNPSVYGFSMHKAGSTLLYAILEHLSRAAGLTYYSVADILFHQNASDIFRPSDVGDPFRPFGACYGGFRNFPAFAVPFLDSARIAFLVRDPRDMITSLYFSTRYSHPTPPPTASEGAREELLTTRARLEEMDIDSFAREIVYDYVKEFEGYIAQGFHWRANVATYRYEDVIFRKRAWVEHLCAWYGWNITVAFKDMVSAGVDVSVQGERPDQHIRQVKPGNYHKHLRKDTVAAVSQVLAEPLRMYGYE